MDGKKYMLLINGQDKTDSVASFRFQDGMCEVVYNSSPKLYHYRAEKVQLLKVQSRIDSSQFIITVDGNPFSQVDEILDFGPFYRFLRTGKTALTYPKSQVELQKNCLTNQKQASVFEYFKETAAAVSLVAEGGLNILSAQYERIKSVSDATVLSCYLDSSKKPAVRTLPEAVIYPFGLNQSQKTAVENALSSQVSIIQGPPGTGKTQTILNIISNAVRNGQTVAVVSNNNSATLNVAEKLEKKGLSFLTAFLGSRANKEHFLEAQTGQYPDMSAWVLEPEEKSQLDQEVTVLSKELSEMLNAKNRIAAIEQELLQLTPEQHYFSEYYNTYAQAPKNGVKGLSSQKILSLWLEYEQHAQQESKLGLLQKISILFRFNRSALKVFLQTPELVIPYLQRQFYVVHRQELAEERAQLEKKLEQYAFNEKMAELTEKSLRLFRAELSERFHWQEPRRRFEMRDFRGKSREFNREYPVILSTTYSIKGTLSFEHIYDYLIVDEASQVDLATGVKKHGRVSEYDSENLLYAVIQDVLQKEEFSFVDCAVHVSLVNLVKDYSMLTEEETAYARNPLTHVDFLLFRRMDKSPLLAVEVDGVAFHAAGSTQADRDEKKNRIFEQCGIPLLRLRTDRSGEEERIEQALRSTVSNS